MKSVVVMILCTFIFSSCATREFRYVYTCYTPAMWGKQMARYCWVIEDSSKHGLAHHKKNEWIFEPKYTTISTVGNHFFLKEDKEDTYIKMDFDKKNESKTNFLYIYTAEVDASKKISRRYFYTKNDEIVLISKDGHYDEKKTIKNIDLKESLNEYGTRNANVYGGIFEGVIVRHRVKDEVYYAIYNGKSELIKDKIPVNKLRLWNNFIYGSNYDGYLMPMLQVDEERDLYWPLIWWNNELLEKPEHIAGIENSSTRSWLEPSYNVGHRPIAGRGISFTDLYIVYKDKNGNEKTSARHLDLKMGTDLRTVRGIFVEPEKANVLDRLYKVNSIYIASDGKIYNEKYFVEEKDKSFSFTKFRLKEKFKSFDELVAFFDDYNAKKDQIASSNRNKYEDEQAEDRARKQALAASVEAERQKLINRENAQKQAARAEIKRQSDAAWSGVSNQLQNRAREADQKAGCISKRTQMKKDFLDGKQNWYMEGGCN